ncbi:MAG: hypothetical protein RID25_26290 [Cyclobacteriaceae bacterium]
MKKKKSDTRKQEKAKLDKESIAILSFFVLLVIGIIVYNVWNNTPPTTWVSLDEQLPNNKVCMVNDAYMGVEQIKVPVAGKIYYGCCENCVEKLNSKESSRFATDPHTGEKVDKADAYIVLKSKSTGEVYYFESAETYQQFKTENSAE